uniref:RNA polymerase subunit H/Rpb5 C-terminal domain-containing protein n=1 Tax=Leersia perrieri TaxID=77586 RepID=A0A0D9Y0B4_9ORYZ
MSIETAESTNAPAPTTIGDAPAAQEVSHLRRITEAMSNLGFGSDDDVHEVPACITAMIDRDSVESHRLFRARRTAMEMLWDRGYSVPEAEIARTLPEFRAWWGESSEIQCLTFTTTLISNPCKKVQIVFCAPDPVKVATIREIYLRTKGENLSRLILVLQSRILSKAKEAIKEVFKFKVDIFEVTDLVVNITKHVLTPKHEILTEDQKAKLLKDYKIEDSQLPRMLESDAVARYYGLDKGTVVKVKYNGELTGNHVAYRCIS